MKNAITVLCASCVLALSGCATSSGSQDGASPQADKADSAPAVGRRSMLHGVGWAENASTYASAYAREARMAGQAIEDSLSNSVKRYAPYSDICLRKREALLLSLDF